MTQANFDVIRKIAYEVTGINLSDHKKNMIYGRLARRIRQRGLSSFDDYCRLIELPDNDEMTDFINAITTNLTSFFRENHHFEFLRETAFPELVRKNAASKRVRIWSAGCSTGEEPYSISICAKEKLPTSQWDIKILATDLDTNVVAHGKRGVYAIDRVESLEADLRKRWFLVSESGREVRVKSALQELITFKPLNLLGKWPMGGKFDIIFCRNVVIYFDKPTQGVLFNRYADILAPGGYLIIGHSESLNTVTDRFKPLGKTIYQKIG